MPHCALGAAGATCALATPPPLVTRFLGFILAGWNRCRPPSARAPASACAGNANATSQPPALDRTRTAFFPIAPPETASGGARSLPRTGSVQVDD
jgi:hypothetical protein